jgi:hypothetical protein
VNGITFQADPVGLGCPVALTDAAEAEIRQSPIAFTATYLPEGYTFQYELAASCQGRVVSIGQVFAGPQGMLNIGRWATNKAALPEAEPEAVTVAGKPAVKIGTGADLFLSEAFGMTEIAGAGLDYGQIVRIAEGLRPR